MGNIEDALTCRKQKNAPLFTVSLLVWEIIKVKVSRTLPLLLIIGNRKYIEGNSAVLLKDKKNIKSSSQSQKLMT